MFSYQEKAYDEGYYSSRTSTNPYNYKCQIELYCWWEGGHFDAWGSN